MALIVNPSTAVNPALTDGSIPYVSAGALVDDHANLAWDTVNHRINADVRFAPSGSGAILTRTVQDALRAMVRTGDYSTAGNFNTAQAALTESIGIKALRLGTGNADGIVFPTQGAAPFQLSAGGGTFSGTFDSTLSIQYNYNRAVATEPLINIGIEADYNDGAAHYCEINLDYTSKDGLFSGRQFGWNINRATNVGTWAFIGGTIRFETIVNNGELIFTTATGKIGRSVNDGTGTTAAAAVAGLVLSNSNSGGLGIVSSALQFDVNGSGAVKLYSSRLGASGAIFKIATDNASGVITERWSVDSSGNAAPLSGAGQLQIIDGTAGTPGFALNTVNGSGFYKGGFGTLSYSNGGVEAVAFAGGFGLGSASVVQWSSTAAGSGSADVVLSRTGAGVLGLNAVLNVASSTATPAAGSTSARLLFGTTAGFGIYYGSGAPTVSAAKGSLYLRSDGSGTTDRAYINTNGTTTWTALTTVA